MSSAGIEMAEKFSKAALEALAEHRKLCTISPEADRAVSEAAAKAGLEVGAIVEQHEIECAEH
jgi:hypothetical protein